MQRHSHSLHRRPRFALLSGVVVGLGGALLLLGCPSDPFEVDDSGTSSTSASSTSFDPSTTGPVTGSSSSGVVDDTGSSGGGDPVDCCATHPEAGCGDPDVAACVCDQEAFCCAFAWDAMCVELADQCGGCGAGTTTGDTTTGGADPVCCAPSDQPGCAEDPALETCVCGVDPFCCDTQWDDQCVQTGVDQCANACDGGGGDCCAPAGTPGCPSDPMVETCVCGLDAFCCDTQWDGMCVDSAQNDCGLQCMVGGGGDCCMGNGSPGCDEPPVQDCVCAIDPFCCDTEWDGQCVAEAQYTCMSDCGLPPANVGDCCMPQVAPGCDDMAVTDCTCMIDGGCCVFPWSDACIQIAVTACGIMCPGVMPLPPCCLTSMTPGCSDMVVEDCVCALDAFCCDTEWDGQCVNEAQMDCMLDCMP